MVESTDIHGQVNRRAGLKFAKYFQTLSATNIFPCLKGSLSTALLTNAFHTALECQILLQRAVQSNATASAVAQSERQLARRILVSNWIYLYHHLISEYPEMAYFDAWEPPHYSGPSTLSSTVCTPSPHGG
jgi:hypothetical protein